MPEEAVNRASDAADDPSIPPLHTWRQIGEEVTRPVTWLYTPHQRPGMLWPNVFPVWWSKDYNTPHTTRLRTAVQLRLSFARTWYGTTFTPPLSQIPDALSIFALFPWGPAGPPLAGAFHYFLWGFFFMATPGSPIWGGATRGSPRGPICPCLQPLKKWSVFPLLKIIEFQITPPSHH